MSSDPSGSSPIDNSGMVLSSASRFGDKWMASHELSPLAKGLELLVPLAKGAPADRAAVAQLMGRWIVHATRENLNEAAELLLAMQETFGLGEDEALVEAEPKPESTTAEAIEAVVADLPPVESPMPAEVSTTPARQDVKSFASMIAEASALAQQWRESGEVPALARACAKLEEAAHCDDADEQAADDLFGTWEQQARDLDDAAAQELLGAFRTALSGETEVPPQQAAEPVHATPLQESSDIPIMSSGTDSAVPPMTPATPAGPVTMRDIEAWIAADNVATLVDQYPLLPSISLKRRVIDWSVPIAKEGRPAALLEIGAMEENPALVKHLNALIDAAPPDEIGRYIEIDGMPKTQKRMAAVVLGYCKTPAAEGMLVRLLRDGSPLVRSAAALGLGHQGREGAVAALKKSVREDQAAVVRAAAAKGLAQIGNKTALAAFEEAVLNTSPSREVEVALRELKGKVHKPTEAAGAAPASHPSKLVQVEKKKKPLPVGLIIKAIVMIVIIGAAWAYAYKTWKKYDVYDAPTRRPSEITP